MVPSPISDVWKTIEQDLRIFHSDNFDQIPSVSGVYAWFYPLHVTSYDLDEFLEEVRGVHLYDATEAGTPKLKRDGVARLGWSSLKWDGFIQLENPPTDISPTIRSAWEELKTDDGNFDSLRRVFMRASLLMPPLYVGKAKVLRDRCHRHIDGRSDFSTRYKKRAEQLELKCQEVSDLLLVSLTTSEVGKEDEEAEAVVEKVLNLVARPPYGIR